MKSEIVKVTPSLAEHFLSKNILNRNISHNLVTKYATDMENGNWGFTHQGIAFYDDDSVADGQHRLLAIIKSRATVPMMVTYGLRKESALGIDVHRSRSIADGIKIGGFSDWIDTRHIAVINAIAGGKRLTPVETIDWLNAMEDSVKFAVNHLTARRYLANSASQSAVALAHYHNVGEDVLAKFCRVFLSGISEEKIDVSIIKLRDDYFSNPSQGFTIRQEKSFKAQRVILAIKNREVLNRLYPPKEPIWVFNSNNLNDFKFSEVL